MCVFRRDHDGVGGAVRGIDGVDRVGDLGVDRVGDLGTDAAVPDRVPDGGGDRQMGSSSLVSVGQP